MRQNLHSGRVFALISVSLVLVVISVFPFAQKAKSDASVGWTCQRTEFNGRIQNVSAVDGTTAWAEGWGATGPGSLILKTTDGGTTWNRVSAPNFDVWDVAAISDRTAWAAGFTNDPRVGIIARTDDGGTSWNTQYSGGELTLLKICTAGADVVWAMGSRGEVVRTTDGGSHWTRADISTRDFYQDFSAIDASTAFAAGSKGGDTMTGLISRTTDGGASWSNIPIPDSPLDMIFGIAATSPTNAWAVSDHVIYHTANGLDWTRQYSGALSSLYSVAAVDGSTAWVTGGAGIILETSDCGATWNPQYAWPAEDVETIDAADASNLWAGGGRGTIFHTTNGGEGTVPRPYVTGLPPYSQYSGPVGSEVTIDGFRFGARSSSSFVSFGSIPAARYTSWGTQEIKCVVPEMDVPTTVPLKVTTEYGTSNEIQFTVTLPAPTITSVTPNSGVGGTTVPVVITGTNFQEGAHVILNGSGVGVTVSDVTVVSPEKITCSVNIPRFTSLYPWLSFDINVANPDFNQAQVKGGFLFYPTQCGFGAVMPVALFSLITGLLFLAGARRRRIRSAGI